MKKGFLWLTVFGAISLLATGCSTLTFNQNVKTRVGDSGPLFKQKTDKSILKLSDGKNIYRLRITKKGKSVTVNNIDNGEKLHLVDKSTKKIKLFINDKTEDNSYYVVIVGNLFHYCQEKTDQCVVFEKVK